MPDRLQIDAQPKTQRVFPNGLCIDDFRGHPFDPSPNPSRSFQASSFTFCFLHNSLLHRTNIMDPCSTWDGKYTHSTHKRTQHTHKTQHTAAQHTAAHTRSNLLELFLRNDVRFFLYSLLLIISIGIVDRQHVPRPTRDISARKEGTGFSPPYGTVLFSRLNYA